MTLDEQLEILQAAKRGEVDYHCPELPGWWRVGKEHKFNFEENIYRIADPYAELKAAAKDPTKDVLCDGVVLENPIFDAPSYCYEIRDKPKPKKVVKYLCYDRCGELRWRAEGTVELESYWYRRPAFDKECEV